VQQHPLLGASQWASGTASWTPHVYRRRTWHHRQEHLFVDQHDTEQLLLFSHQSSVLFCWQQAQHLWVNLQFTLSRARTILPSRKGSHHLPHLSQL
jgi:hypothetical protein